MCTSNSKKSSMINIHEIASLTISIKLNGVNYHVWSQILNMPITGKKKKEYITGRKVALVEDDPNYDEWEAETL